jgi:C-terminal processing protease CtpA/Prc
MLNKLDMKSYVNSRFFLVSFRSQQVVELEGYVIILVEGRDGKIKLYGSPADRDGLEVADEILDVNERKLDDVPRALVIKHIHEVCMKMKYDSHAKRSGSKNPLIYF